MGWDLARCLPNACHHCLALEALAGEDRDRVLACLANAIKLGGHLVIIDLVAMEPLDPADETVQRWSHDPQYTHGYVVPLFAAIVLWVRRDSFPGDRVRVSWLGVPLLVLAGYGATFLFFSRRIRSGSTEVRNRLDPSLQRPHKDMKDAEEDLNQLWAKKKPQLEEMARRGVTQVGGNPVESPVRGIHSAPRFPPTARSMSSSTWCST